jgi:hypothetical protein
VSDENAAVTWAGRLKREVEAARHLRRTNPWLFTFAILAVCAVSSWWVYDHFWGIPELKRTIEHQQRELDTKRQEIVLLETQLAPVKTAAILKYGNADSRAIVQIAEDVRRFESALRTVENKIRSLSVVVEAEFTTEWKDGKIPDPSHWIRTAGGEKEVEATFVSDDERKTTVYFGNPGDLKILPLSEGYVRMSYRTDAAPGSEIFGTLPENIRELKQFVFRAYGLQKENSNAERARFRTIRIRFFVNGIARFSAHIDLNDELVLETTPLSVVVNKSLPIEFLTP